jgi:1-deoxy-D-xylulose-5-phosphate reductoisomerase
MKRLLILGSTGSIGTQALDVVVRAAGAFEVVGLSAGAAYEPLIEQARAHGVRRIALSDPDAAARAGEAWTGGEVLGGPEGLVELVAASDADLVLNAIVGSAGLGPTIVALTEGIDLALANKESLVVGGELVTALAEATGAQIIPVDSEHSALYQLIAAEAPRAGTIDKLVLTASGGPFRGRSRAELEGVTVEEALRHPTWAMGGKITIDSATLMNKGLEVIEAHHLFGTPYDRIDVVVHPQSIVHGMVQLCDGASLAHLGHPDMRVPIAYALHHPERVDVPVPALDLAQVGSLTFEPPDLAAFPALGLAFAAARAGGTAPCVLNAANEVAVHAFLGERLGFMGIPAVIEGTLEQLPARTVHSFESLYEADAEARRIAGELVAQEALA